MLGSGEETLSERKVSLNLDVTLEITQLAIENVRLEHGNKDHIHAGISIL